MSTRLAVLLGIVAIGAALGIVGIVQPASADLTFGEGPNCHIITPGVVCDPNNNANVLGVNNAQWNKPGSVTGLVNASGFLSNGTLTPQGLLVDGSGISSASAQDGIGISDLSGGLQHEINSTNMVDLSTPASLAGQTVHAILSVDSLQHLPGFTAESFIWCAEPTAGIVGTPGSARCSSPIFGSSGFQNELADVAVTFGGATPFLAVTGVTAGGVIGDVKIEDLDIVPVSVPEPGTLALLLTGVAGLALARKRRNSI
jgi:hypothetical protein